MDRTECAEAWKTITRIYKETEELSPDVTMQKIIETFGKAKTEEVFATVAAIKQYDSRIYGANREYMDSIPVNPESVKREHGNPMLYAGLDDIHTAHINQMITELRRKPSLSM